MITLKDVRQHSTGWLSALSDENLGAVYRYLKEGKSLGEVLHICKKEMPIPADLQPRAMLGDLLNIRAAVLNDRDVVALQVAKDSPGAAQLQSRLAAISSKVNGMERLGWLINLQTERIKDAVSREDGKVMLPTTDAAVRTLGKLLEVYIEKEEDIGVVNITSHEIDKEKFNSTVATFDTDAMHTTVQKFLGIVDACTTKMEISDEGTPIRLVAFEEVDEISEGN